MYKIILVPLDGSTRAEQILSHVENLALAYKSKVILLQVSRPLVVGDGYKSILINESMEESQRQMELAMEYLTEIETSLKSKGIEVQSISELGSVVATIINVAQEEEADLIAMASHGRGGLARVFYGSVAAGVLQAVDRPLLLIRSRKDE